MMFKAQGVLPKKKCKQISNMNCFTNLNYVHQMEKHLTSIVVFFSALAEFFFTCSPTLYL